QHIAALTQVAATAQAVPVERSLFDEVAARVAPLLHLPQVGAIQARIAGLSKMWTWGACGFMVLAAWGYWQARAETGVRLLGAALAATFLGYFFVPFDQGHGWGYRYIPSAWFVVPVFA